MFDPVALKGFVNQLVVQTTNMNAEQAVAAMVRVAQSEKARVIGTATARSYGITPGVRQVVDGIEDAPLTAVKPDGIIVLAWNYLAEIAQDTMDALIARSPTESGDYIRGLIMFINGEPVPDARWAAPPAGVVQIQIVATVPYARRLEVGLAHGHPPTRIYFVKQVSPHIVEETMMSSRSLYGTLAAFSYGYTPLAPAYALTPGSASIRRRRGHLVTDIEHPTITITARTA